MRERREREERNIGGDLKVVDWRRRKRKGRTKGSRGRLREKKGMEITEREEKSKICECRYEGRGWEERR